MTKKEKSEIKYRMKRLARKFCRRNSVYESFDNSVGKLIEKAYLSAYLLCLHENGIQWHDLRKDPNDLPEKMGLGSREVYIEYKDGVNDFAYYRFDKKRWERSENEQLAENVIAWCNIPQFKE